MSLSAAILGFLGLLGHDLTSEISDIFCLIFDTSAIPQDFMQIVVPVLGHRCACCATDVSGGRRRVSI